MLYGGLGNQMFGYAFYLHLKRKYWYALVYLDILIPLEGKPHNGFELQRLFSVPQNYNNRLNRRVRNLYSRYFTKNYVLRVVDQLVGVYAEKPVSIFNPLILYDGFWQSEKYFTDVQEDLRQVFRFDPSRLSERSAEAADRIRSTNSVSVHIRRGDYLSNRELNGICTASYYQKALHEMRARVPDSRFYVFSDDPNWVAENIYFADFELIDWNRSNESWQDMYLMCQCSHNIIANSSFSWWGAWLNTNPDKIIIAPSRWFNSWDAADIVPDGWLRVQA